MCVMRECALISREVTFFCVILHYKKCLIYQHKVLNIQKKYRIAQQFPVTVAVCE